MKKGSKIIYFKKSKYIFICKVSGSFYIKNGRWFLLFFVVVLVLEYDQNTINIQVIPKCFFQKLQGFFFSLANLHGHSYELQQKLQCLHQLGLVSNFSWESVWQIIMNAISARSCSALSSLLVSVSAGLARAQRQTLLGRKLSRWNWRKDNFPWWKEGRSN